MGPKREIRPARLGPSHPLRHQLLEMSSGLYLDSACSTPPSFPSCKQILLPTKATLPMRLPPGPRLAPSRSPGYPSLVTRLLSSPGLERLIITGRLGRVPTFVMTPIAPSRLMSKTRAPSPLDSMLKSGRDGASPNLRSSPRLLIDTRI